MKMPEYQRMMTQVVQAMESQRAVEMPRLPEPPTFYEPPTTALWRLRSAPLHDGAAARPRRRPGFAPWSDEV